MKRYQVIVYDHDIGADEELSYTEFKDADITAHNYWLSGEYEGAIVYDLHHKKIVALHGSVPMAAMPIEK